jgi:hypothetical protein
MKLESPEVGDQMLLAPPEIVLKRDFGMYCYPKITEDDKRLRAEILDNICPFLLEDSKLNMRQATMFCIWSNYGRIFFLKKIVDGTYNWGFTLGEKPFGVPMKWKVGWRFDPSRDLLVYYYF